MQVCDMDTQIVLHLRGSDRRIRSAMMAFELRHSITKASTLPLSLICALVRESTAQRNVHLRAEKKLQQVKRNSFSD